MTKKTTRALKAGAKRFAEAHQKAIAALRRHDFDAFGAAIADERQIIKEQVRIANSAVSRSVIDKKRR